MTPLVQDPQKDPDESKKATREPQPVSTPENPWPVRVVSSKLQGWIERLGKVWVEGQIVQLNRRPGASLAFMVLRDTEADFSLPIAVRSSVLEKLDVPLAEGTQIVMHAATTFWPKRGSLQLMPDEIRSVGIGELLARIEQLKRLFAAEGLFAAERKVPLPFLPKKVGLICGRESKAEHDVVVNARERWPSVQFDIREVAVQGVNCVPEVSAALSALDSDPDVEVIVVARGGGAVEDLLPFSNESMVRLVASLATPIVSAIGHETDSPLLDLVADYRASTPTDAAKRIVPDLRAEIQGLAQARGRMHALVRALIGGEQVHLDNLRSRPCLSDPLRMVRGRAEQDTLTVHRMNRAFERLVSGAEGQLQTLRASLRALSPQATLDRGYAVVQLSDGTLLREADQARPGTALAIRLARGALLATAASTASETANPEDAGT